MQLRNDSARVITQVFWLPAPLQLSSTLLHCLAMSVFRKYIVSLGNEIIWASGHGIVVCLGQITFLGFSLNPKMRWLEKTFSGSLRKKFLWKTNIMTMFRMVGEEGKPSDTKNPLVP